MLICHKNSCSLHIQSPVECIPNGKKLPALEEIVLAILEEARSKHLIDCLHDDYLNDDYHVEVTLTVKEIKAAAAALNISDF